MLYLVQGREGLSQNGHFSGCCDVVQAAARAERCNHSHALRGNACCDACVASSGTETGIWNRCKDNRDAERPARHSHAERGNDGTQDEQMPSAISVDPASGCKSYGNAPQ